MTKFTTNKKIKKNKKIEKFSKGGQEVQTYNYKVNKSQRCYAQHGLYGK